MAVRSFVFVIAMAALDGRSFVPLQHRDCCCILGFDEDIIPVLRSMRALPLQGALPIEIQTAHTWFAAHAIETSSVAFGEHCEPLAAGGVALRLVVRYADLAVKDAIGGAAAAFLQSSLGTPAVLMEPTGPWWEEVKAKFTGSSLLQWAGENEGALYALMDETRLRTRRPQDSYGTRADTGL